jgi:quercetin dioxygenase-like cupin family protein
MSSTLRSVPFAAALLVPAAAAAQQPPDTAGAHPRAQHVLLDSRKLDWKPAPAVLPRGAQVAVLEGDPAKPGLFTMRLRVPDGFQVKPHFHDADEHLTVLDGTFVVGLGDSWSDTAGTALSAGGFAVMPAGTHHFARARGETIVQIHAMGPWKLTYVNPADDPRTATPDR